MRMCFMIGAQSEKLASSNFAQIADHVRNFSAQAGSMSSSQWDDDNKKGAWTPEEDEKLIELVSRFGPKSWSQIARDVPGRSGKSCRLRCVAAGLLA